MLNLTFRNLVNWFFNYWWLEIGHGGNIYIMKTGKHYKSGHAFFFEIWFTSTPLDITSGGRGEIFQN